MKILTSDHLERLDALYLEEYLAGFAKDLSDIEFPNPFPPKKEEYMKFVTHVYGVAKKYGLDNEKYAFSLMLAWHVRGENFLRERGVAELLGSKETDAHTKYRYLMKIALESMEACENPEGVEYDG